MIVSELIAHLKDMDSNTKVVIISGESCQHKDIISIYEHKESYYAQDEERNFIVIRVWWSIGCITSVMENEEWNPESFKWH